MNQIPNIEEDNKYPNHDVVTLTGNEGCSMNDTLTHNTREEKVTSMRFTHNVDTREVEEYRYFQAPNVPIANVQAQDPAGFTYELAEVDFHHQLQKARDSGENRILAVLRHHGIDYTEAIKTRREWDKNQAELDQDKK